MKEFRALIGIIRRIDNILFGYNKPKGRKRGKNKKIKKRFQIRHIYFITLDIT